MGLLAGELEEPPREEGAIDVAFAGGTASKPLDDCDSLSSGSKPLSGCDSSSACTVRFMLEGGCLLFG